jgi:hypothetical protein
MKRIMKAFNKVTAILCIVVLLAASGCAIRPGNIKSTYFPVTAYSSYDCDQISAEMVRVHHELMVLSGKQDSEATKDEVAFTVGMLLFWPAIFFMAGGDHKEEISSLKGQYEALQQAAIQKGCK